ncbi:hypothetical protein QYF36_016166 [Acer negundo]|nr:hypothetical protein QYF36_016166 [Acer negundo]
MSNSKPSFKEKKSEPQQYRSGLPKDILRLILEKLPWSERLRLSLVQLIVSANLLTHLYKKRFTVEEATKGTERDFFFYAVPCASSHGWVLFSTVIGEMKHLFLYRPFTNEVIRFPGLEMGFSNNASFYLNPTSSDCMADESFYCSLSNGKLGAFNIKQQEWKLLWNLQSELSPLVNNSYMFAFNGDLIWVVAIGATYHVLYGVPAEGNAREFAGKIYNLFCNRGTPWSRSLNCVDSSWSESPYYVWMEVDSLTRIWIQPPLQRIFRASDLLQSGSGLIPKHKST